VPKKEGTVHHPLANDARSLLWLANQNSITIHVWPSRVPKLYYPDICIFDLDPAGDDGSDILRATALALRDFLADLGLPSWIKTSGSKGFHIAVPLDGKSDFGVVARFTHAVGRLLVKRYPRLSRLNSRRSIAPGEYMSIPKKRIQCDVCCYIHRSRKDRCAGFCTMHVGRS
jgi:bifunctional non-homologous end joining protein LigD